jgi:hypothetical protein
MATTTQQKTESFTSEPFMKFTEQGEEFLRGARKASAQYIDLYEKAAARSIELERKVANATQQEWLKSLIEGHVEFATELSSTCTSAARELLK